MQHSGPGPMDVDPKESLFKTKDPKPGGRGPNKTGSSADQKTSNAMGMGIDIDSGDKEDISLDDSDSPGPQLSGGGASTRGPTKVQKKHPSMMRWAEVVSDMTAQAGVPYGIPIPIRAVELGRLKDWALNIRIRQSIL